ncbi:MAG: hypothetical protein D6815_07430 [Candidatus Dadabacteria bacterium]|nr:MAG: hypothetical protein D6815_07430 [Candidatus Dadabacteria bacterium]
MGDLAERTVRLAGNSGNRYEFALYPLEHRFVHTRDAVYVVGRLNQREAGEADFEPLFVSQTGLLAERINEHRRNGCFNADEATHVGVYTVLSEPLRIAIVNDLIKRHAPRCPGLERCGACRFA